jgi:superfamily II DNA/RNA helicase
MVFTQTKRAADQVTIALAGRGFAAAAVHGDLGQSQRERALRAFRNGKVDVLVATDVAARGIDVDDVTHVVNYECPEDEKTYVHRIGRTGRAGRAGVAVTFVDWRETQRWKLIDTALGLGQPEPAETYSTSDHLYADLSIPPEVTGSLPRDQRDVRAGLDAEAEEDLGETGRTRTKSRGSRSRTRTRSKSRTGASGGDATRAGDAGTGGTGTGGTGREDGDTPARSRRRKRTRGGREVSRDANGSGEVIREVIREVPAEGS